MRYGILIKEPDFTNDYRANSIGDLFTFEDLDHGMICKPGEVGATHTEGLNDSDNFLPQPYFAEISEEEYDRLSPEPQPKTTKLHPKLQSAFDGGEWGCQEESVRKVLEAMTELFKGGA